ncbi:uncharacterized, partial [Tachysurus ichikawai]
FGKLVFFSEAITFRFNDITGFLTRWDSSASSSCQLDRVGCDIISENEFEPDPLAATHDTITTMFQR